MHTAKAITVSLFTAALLATLPSRALAPSPLDYLSASAPVPAPEPRDFVLLVMSLAAIALVGRRSR
jgi:hypothetical protein